MLVCRKASCLPLLRSVEIWPRSKSKPHTLLYLCQTRCNFAFVVCTTCSGHILRLLTMSNLSRCALVIVACAPSGEKTAIIGVLASAGDCWLCCYRLRCPQSDSLSSCCACLSSGGLAVSLYCYIVCYCCMVCNCYTVCCCYIFCYYYIVCDIPGDAKKLLL